MFVGQASFENDLRSVEFIFTLLYLEQSLYMIGAIEDQMHNPNMYQVTML